MIKQIKINEKIYQYSLRKSSQTKSLRLTINSRSKLNLSAPNLTPQFIIDKFIQSHSDWIQNHLNDSEYLNYSKSPAEIRRQYIRHKPLARKIVTERLAYFNRAYNFTYRTITIRDQSSRWGSCTKDGNLSFNYRLALLPSALADLIVVHELCHLGELNHSHRFWALVRKTLPNYRSLKLQLDKIKMESL